MPEARLVWGLSQYFDDPNSAAMSFKAKNLTYEKPDEPEFLRRLREQVSGRGDADRHEIAAPRRRGLAKIEALEDDAPVIVGEDGNVLHEDEVKAINEQSDDMPHEDRHPDTKTPGQSGEMKAEGPVGHGIGPARKKRKAVKVAVDENKEASDQNEAASEGPANANSADGEPPSKKKKKRAKVTLSFDSDDDG